MRIPILLLALALPFLLVACGSDDALGGSQVTVAFGVGAPTADVASTIGPSAVSVLPGVVRIEGSNGVLDLSTVAFVVEEVEFDCDDDRAGPCADFETDPVFIDLPLGSGTVEATSARIRPGTYDELEFEIDDLDDVSPSVRSALLAEIRSRFPAFPSDASMIVAGTFTPIGGTARAFEVFVDADVEVELDLRPPLVVDADGVADRTIVVDVRPDRWFVRADGSVRDLSAFDGDLIELEVEVDDGFVDVDFDVD